MIVGYRVILVMLFLILMMAARAQDIDFMDENDQDIDFIDENDQEIDLIDEDESCSFWASIGEVIKWNGQLLI
jgi:thioredoxin-related protein